ncbi:hypothetical protein [Spiroplasma endosymbiont of Amphibalanus improvisus]|uniref:hypothetical protein n=1 Tax=Spiroplasma endosymbiont of Amphibalanus improvisus TaxID=3066327 RepID=UPI00313A76BF
MKKKYLVWIIPLILLLPFSYIFFITDTSLIEDITDVSEFSSGTDWTIPNFEMSVNAAEFFDSSDEDTEFAYANISFSQNDWDNLSSLQSIAVIGSFDYLTHKKPMHHNVEYVVGQNDASTSELHWYGSTIYTVKKGWSKQTAEIQLELQANHQSNQIKFTLITKTIINSAYAVNKASTHCQIDTIHFGA